MSKYHFVVLGGGGMGFATVHDLRRNCDAASVTLIEPNETQRRQAAANLGKLRSAEDAPITYLEKPNEYVLGNADVIVSCAPHTANIDLAQMAIDYNVPYCDLGGSHDVVAVQKRMAYGATSPVVPDCGVSPGLSNIVAVHLAKKHACTRIKVRCGGNPLPRPDPKENPLMYKLTWSPAGLAQEYAHKEMTIKNSIFFPVQALSKIERFDDEFESAPTSNNSFFSADYLRDHCGVEWYDYGTLRYHGHYKAVLNGKNRVDEDEFVKRVLAMPELVFDRERDSDRLILVVEGSRIVYGHEKTFIHRFRADKDPITKFTAMELMTSWGIAIVAHHMASGRGQPAGFATPEMFVDSDWVLSEVDRRLALYNMW